MVVLPEDMKKLDETNLRESVKIIEAYIRYMQERISHAMSFAATLQALSDMGAELRIADGKVSLSLEAQIQGGLEQAEKDIQDSAEGLRSEIVASAESVMAQVTEAGLGTSFVVDAFGAYVKDANHPDDSFIKLAASGERTSIEMYADGAKRVDINSEGSEFAGTVAADAFSIAPFKFIVMDGEIALVEN